MRALFFTFFILIGCAFLTKAQSAVYIFQDNETGKSDYVFRYGMANVDSAKNIALRQIIELGYQPEHVKPIATAATKGYGIIIRSYYRKSNGINVTIYGAALGQTSYETAEEQAVKNLKVMHSTWNEKLYEYNIIQYFYDEPD